jgi:DNA-binding PadR family transcriptional regulator
MLELATLGVLLREPMHGYGLKSWLERYMGSCITANFGAIYPLLRRLEEQGLIASEQDAGDRGLTRTIYSITEAGRAHWHAEMLDQPNESWLNSRTRFMTKFYFFAGLTSDERISLLSLRLAACRERLANHPLAGEQYDAYQRSLKEYVAQLLYIEIGWLELQLARERERSSTAEPVAAGS